jgi:two-component system, NtrC family, response regulator AtoC
MAETARKRVLIAEDEQNLRWVLGAIVGREGHEVLQAGDGAEALELLQKHVVHLLITDLRMPRMDGMELLRRARQEWPDVPVVIITAHGTVENAVEAVKLGAFDYIEKPFEHEQIRQVVRKALQHEAAAQADARPLEPQPGCGRYSLVGQSPAIQQVFALIEKVADTPSTVLITGESGTGKELVAKALHEHSSRCKGPFIKINCAAIPATLMESELFGYEKGAFTGAVGSKPGRFELAHQGTLLLDEIGEMPVEMQVKLLRVLQDGQVERLGGVRSQKIDVRLVTSTKRDLQKEAAAGVFREDLYYRLSVVPIQLPPLRDRRGDIPLLVDHFVGRFNERLKKRLQGCEAEALERLGAYSWPGNIRELENVMERSVLFGDGPRIRVADLPPEVAAVEADGRAKAASLKQAVRAETERVEREMIVRALDETGGNVTRAAQRLQISRKGLQLKMKELGLRERGE